MVDCPDCENELDYEPCPLCDGTGEVEEGTKGWMNYLLESKENDNDTL